MRNQFINQWGFSMNLKLIDRTFQTETHRVFTNSAEDVVNNGNVIIAFSNQRVERHINPFVKIHFPFSVQTNGVAAEINLVEKHVSSGNLERGFRVAERVLAGFFDAQNLEHGNHCRQMINVRLFKLQIALTAQGVHVAPHSQYVERQVKFPQQSFRLCNLSALFKSSIFQIDRGAEARRLSGNQYDVGKEIASKNFG
ncbi:MAG: DUF1350 family protein [Thermoguttaceae bacterium]|nr:DUF1350 family protein [Thermoguttaceae bacterium]